MKAGREVPSPALRVHEAAPELCIKATLRSMFFGRECQHWQESESHPSIADWLGGGARKMRSSAKIPSQFNVPLKALEGLRQRIDRGMAMYRDLS